MNIYRLNQTPYYRIEGMNASSDAREDEKRKQIRINRRTDSKYKQGEENSTQDDEANVVIYA